MAPGFQGSDGDEYVFSVNQQRFANGAEGYIRGDVDFNSVGDENVYSCRLNPSNQVARGIDNMYVDENGDDVFVGSVYS